MALRPRQVKFYKDLATIYRGEKDALLPSGDQGFRLKTSNNPCKLFTTPNFDKPVGGFAQHKEGNVLTANILDLDLAVDIRDMDVVKMTSVAVPATTPYFRVDGAPQSRGGVANLSRVKLVPISFDPAPIVA